MTYRADLDGLRALAVIPVVLFHLGVPGVPGGFVGVDVFFVLSGFLITRLLAADLARGNFSLAAFYDRRIRRIFPAFALVLVLSALAAPLLLLPDDLMRFGKTLVAAALAASNIEFARQSGYFAQSAELSPLLHTWSLAVEEQFYFLFPLALWAAWRGSRTRLAALIWLALAASFALSVAGVWLKPTLTFYLLPTRAWELLAGSALALGLIPQAGAAWQRELGAASGVLTIALTVALYTRDIAFPGLAAGLPCVGAGLVIWAGMAPGHCQTWAGRLLSTRALVLVGLVSYSLYLWHWPLIVFAKFLTNGNLTLSVQVALALAALVLAALTWHYVEKPLRAGGWPWPAPRHRLLGASLGVLAIALGGLGLYLARGLPQRLSPAITALDGSRLDTSLAWWCCHRDEATGWTFDRTCIVGAEVSPQVVVFADSHGVELSAALGMAAEARGLSIRQVTGLGCPPATGFVTSDRPDCPRYVDAMLNALSAASPATVILAAHYFQWMQDGGNQSGEIFWKGFAETVRTLRNAGHSVIIVGAIPNHPGRIPVPSALARWTFYGGTPQDYRFALNRSLAAEVESHIRGIAAETGAIYVSMIDFFCPDDRGCRGYRSDQVLYFDDNHLSLSGAKQVVAEVLAPAIWSEYAADARPPTR